MDDEVFVQIEYQPRDFVAARQVGLIARVRETNVLQLGSFVFLGALGVLIFAPDPIGRIIAALAGSLIGLAILVMVYGWIRATTAPLPKNRPKGMALEISNEGVVVKSDERYMHLRWSDFERIAFGRGIFALMGKVFIIVPARSLRDDQMETLRSLAKMTPRARSSSPSR
jgi:hypothetical protein